VDPAYQAYQILHWGFVAAPLLAGIDKFLGFLTDWQKYLAPAIANLVSQVGLTPRIFMEIVGAIEIVAAALVAMKPKFGAYVVAVWLLGIIINLLILPGFYDIALRDFGLLLGAIALGRLSQSFDRPRPHTS
jgi:hypothetical protein